MEATAGRNLEGWFQVEGTACVEPVEGEGDVNTWELKGDILVMHYKSMHLKLIPSY